LAHTEQRREPPARMERMMTMEIQTFDSVFDGLAEAALAVEELDEETLKALAASRMDSSHDRLDPLMD
jgi:hypothetical protein